MRYAFIAEHRDRFCVRAMCRCLAVQPSGYYAWQKNPLSQRAREDARQTRLLRQAWNDSGKVYGYRKLHDDLLDQGETCCPNRVARLTSITVAFFAGDALVWRRLDVRASSMTTR